MCTCQLTFLLLGPQMSMNANNRTIPATTIKRVQTHTAATSVVLLLPVGVASHNSVLSELLCSRLTMTNTWRVDDNQLVRRKQHVQIKSMWTDGFDVNDGYAIKYKMQANMLYYNRVYISSL